jgi:hypothetical protein
MRKKVERVYLIDFSVRFAEALDKLKEEKRKTKTLTFRVILTRAHSAPIFLIIFF